MAIIQLNAHDFQITLGGKTITLLPKEFALFQFLYQHPGQTFSRELLLDHVWPLEDPVDRTVDDHVYRLRKKIKEWESYLSLETIRGTGYQLRLTTPSETTTPSLNDEHFQKHFTQLLTKYHLFGQGAALQTLAGQQQILGAKLDPFYDMYTELLKGNWAILLKESIPFWDRAYFMAVLYGLIDDDPANGKTLIEQLLKKDMLPVERTWELQAMDLVFFHMWCGDFKSAGEMSNWAYEKVLEYKLEGFKLAILIQQIFPLCMTESFQAADNKMRDIEPLLKEKPYLRELSYFNLSKGLCYLSIGDIKTGKNYLDEGITIMKQAKFELQYFHALTHLTHCTKQLLGENDTIYLHYRWIRNEVINACNGKSIKNNLLRQIKIFL